MLGFVDDVIFSYNGGNRPESKTTSMFVQFAKWRHQSDVRLRSPGGGTGGEVCRLRLHLVCCAMYTQSTLPTPAVGRERAAVDDRSEEA